MNARIRAAALEVKEQKVLSEIGLEGFSSFTDFLSGFADFFRINKGAIIDSKFGFFKRLDASGVISKAKGIDYEFLKKIEVYQPVGFKDNYHPYILFLSGVVKGLSTVDTRLITPLTKYLQMALTQPDYSDVIWIDKDITFVESDAIKKTMATFFDPSIERNKASDKVAFGEVFFSVRELESTYNNTIEVSKFVANIDLEKIKRAELKLYEVLQVYIKNAKENPNLIASNKQTLSRLVAVVNGIVEELELLSVSLYSFNTAYIALSDTFDKLKQDLK
jgi:hypothetical protein